MSKKYSFTTYWQLKAPLPQVWDAIYDSLEWPQWWKGVHEVTEIRKNDANGINGIRAYTWKSVLPYQLSFTMRLTEIEPMKCLKGLATGDLDGTGEWSFNEENGAVHVHYYWNVVATKQWMNTFSFLLRPFFIISHNIVMHWGAKGLAKRLGGVLVKG